MYLKLIALFSLSYFSHAKDPSVRELVQLFEKDKVQTVEEALESVSKNYTNYLSEFTATFKSFSLQQSSCDNPRVIVFGQRAKTLMSFNGHKKHRGFNSLEFIEYNLDKKDFDFFEINFSNQGLAVEKNPKKCLNCHKETKPLWENYPSWTFFYGGSDDITKSFWDKDFKKVPYETNSNHKIEQDRCLEEFLKKSSNHPRYKLIPNLKKSYEKTLDYAVSYGDGEYNIYRTKNKHNLTFSSKLSRWNIQRTINKWKKKKNFSRFLEIYYARRVCIDHEKPDKILDFLNPLEKDIYLKSKELKSENEYSIYPVLDLYEALGFPFYELGMHFNFYRNDKKITIDHDPALANSFKRTTDHYYQTGNSDPFSLQYFLYKGNKKYEGLWIEEPDHTLLSYLSFKDNFTVFYSPIEDTDGRLEAFCDSLKSNKKSDSNISSGKIINHDKNLSTKILKRCISCHETGIKIPFSDKELLKKALEQKAHTSKRSLYQEILYRVSDKAKVRMPLVGKPLTNAEVNDLKNYLDNLLEKN